MRYVLMNIRRNYTSVVYSPDGNLIAAGSLGVVYVWDTSSRELKNTLMGHGSHVYSMSISPDGKIIACGVGQNFSSDDIFLWNLKNGKLITTLSGHNDDVRHFRSMKAKTSLCCYSPNVCEEKYLKIHSRFDKMLPYRIIS